MIKYLKSFFSLLILLSIGLTINGSLVPVFDSRPGDRACSCNNSKSSDFDAHEIGGLSRDNSFPQGLQGQGPFVEPSKLDQPAYHRGLGHSNFDPSVFKEHRSDDLAMYVKEPYSTTDLVCEDIDISVERPFAGQPVEIPLLIQEMQKNSALSQQLVAFNKAELTMLELIVKNGSVEALLDLEEVVFEFDRDLYDKGSVGNLAASSLGAVFNQHLSKLVKQIQQVAYDKKGTIRELNYERRQQIAWIVAGYLKEKYPQAYIEILRHYVDNHIIEFISILKLEEDMGFGGKFARVWHDKFMHKNASVNIPSVIHNNEVHKGLLVLKNLYLNGDIIGAQKFYNELHCKQTSSEVKAVVDKFWTDLLKHDLQLYQDNKFYPYHDDRLAKLFPTEQDQRKDFLQQSAEPFICHDVKYELNQSTREILYDLKIDERRFTRFQGNEEQSVKNATLICVLNNAVEKMMETSIPEHKACWLSLIQSVAVVQGFNEEVTFAQFPEVLTEYLEANPVASSTFLLRFVVDVGNNVSHPITFLAETAEGFVKIGSLLLRTLYFPVRHGLDATAYINKSSQIVTRAWELGLRLSTLSKPEFEAVVAKVVADMATLQFFGLARSAVSLLRIEQSLIAIQSAANATVSLEKALEIYEKAFGSVDKLVSIAQREGQAGFKFIANLAKEERLEDALRRGHLVFSRYSLERIAKNRTLDQIKILGQLSQQTGLATYEVFKRISLVAQGKLLSGLAAVKTYDGLMKPVQAAADIIDEVERVLVTPEGFQFQPPKEGLLDSLFEYAKTQQNAPKGGASKVSESVESTPGARSNIAKAKNMDNFFEKFDFGKKIKPYLEKTRLQYKDESIYKVVEKIKDFKLKKGDRLYLDGFHADHLEVFNDRGMFKFVLNFDGSINEAKTISGMGRRIPL